MAKKHTRSQNSWWCSSREKSINAVFLFVIIISNPCRFLQVKVSHSVAHCHKQLLTAVEKHASLKNAANCFGRRPLIGQRALPPFKQKGGEKRTAPRRLWRGGRERDPARAGGEESGKKSLPRQVWKVPLKREGRWEDTCCFVAFAGWEKNAK